MTAPTPQPDAERVQGEVTAAVRRGAEAMAYEFGESLELAHDVEFRAGLTAALNGPADDEGMDDVTIAIHVALCEDSPNECIEWRGACVKAVEAARKALLGSDQ